MSTYKDFTFEKSNYKKMAEYTDSDAMILSIRNILLSRPGNFPFNPSIGMDIGKYQFDLLDNQTINDIKTELNRQIAAYMPDLQNIQIFVQRVDGKNGESFLGIAITATKNGNIINNSFLLNKDRDNVEIFNETF